MRSGLVVLLAIVTAQLSIQSPAEAGMIVVDNLSQPDPSGGFIAGSGVFGPSAGATQFVVGAGTWSIDGITIRIEELTANNPDQMVLRVLGDNGGTPNTTVFGTLAPTSNITTLGNYAFTPVAPFSLAGGTSYWLAGFATAVNANYPWRVTPSETDNGILGWSIGSNTYTSGNNGATWGFADDRSLIFRIEATQAAAVPEPSSLALLGLGIVGLAGWARRRSRPEAITTSS